MTRKEALFQAVLVLKSLDIEKEKKSEIINKLSELIEELPICVWSENTIFDAFEQFIIDNGRVPNCSDLDYKNLPSHPTIENRFKMSAREFIDRYYGDKIVKKKCNSNIYYNHTKEYWINDFKTQYEQLNRPNMIQYNKLRRNGTPCTSTLVNLCGLKNYSELIKFCGYNRAKNKIFKKEKQIVKVERNFLNTNSDVKQQIENIIDKYK